MRRAATAAIVPHVEKWDRHEFFYQLDTLARELDPPPPPPEPKPVLPYDREAVKAWIEAQGMAAVPKEVESA